MKDHDDELQQRLIKAAADAWPKIVHDNKDPPRRRNDELQKRVREVVAAAWPQTDTVNAHVVSEARILSNLVWAAETLLASAPNMHRDLLVERVGDVMRVVRERANALGRAVKNPE